VYLFKKEYGAGVWQCGRIVVAEGEAKLLSRGPTQGIVCLLIVEVVVELVGKEREQQKDFMLLANDVNIHMHQCVLRVIAIAPSVFGRFHARVST